MIKLIENLPDNVLGYEGIGKVTGKDYEKTLMPAFKEMHKKYKKLRFIYFLGDDFTGYDFKAIFDDTLIGFEAPTAWERIAVVTDNEKVRTGVHLIAFAIPSKVRIFKCSEYDEAKRWVSE